MKNVRDKFYVCHNFPTNEQAKNGRNKFCFIRAKYWVNLIDKLFTKIVSGWSQFNNKQTIKQKVKKYALFRKGHNVKI